MPKGQTHTDERIEQDFDEFDFSKMIEEYGHYIVLGMRRSGKTTFMCQVSQHLPFSGSAQHIVIAGNENIKKQWAQAVHPIWIHNPSRKFLRKLINTQNERVKECDIAGVVFPNQWEVVLWIDDCGTLKEFMQSVEMKWLASNGRQIKAWIFIILQKLTHACTEARENSDGVFLLQTQHAKTIKALHSEFASTVPFGHFQSVIAGATRHRGMCAINAHPFAPTIRQIFRFAHLDLLHKDGWKAKIDHVGDKSHWEYALRYYKPPVSSLGKNAVITQQQEEEDSEDEDVRTNSQTPIPEKGSETMFSQQPFTHGHVVLKFNCKPRPSSNSSSVKNPSPIPE